MVENTPRRRSLGDLYPQARRREPLSGLRYQGTRRYVPPMLQGLNAEQITLARTLDGPVLALAGPGTGKTETITKRMAWAVTSGHTPAHEILATTFTTDAAQEMRDRVAALVGRRDAEAMTITTLNALGWMIVRRDQDLLGLRDVRLAMPLAHDIVDDLIDGLELSQDEAKGLEADAVLQCIAAFKTLGVSPDEAPEAWPSVAARITGHAAPDVPPEDDEGAMAEADAERLAWLVAARIFGAYVREMRTDDAADYADQCALAVRLLSEHPEVRAHWRRQFRLVMVDEFQDSDPAQWRMIRLIAGDGADANLCCIGDEDQCLYPWRLADVNHILNFEEWYPTVTVVTLTVNYRSRPAIVAAANRLIAHNTMRRPKTLRSFDGQERGAVTSLTAETLPGLATQIARDILGRGTAPSQCMLLARSNRGAQIAAGVLAAHGIEVAHTTPVVSEALRHALAAARLAINPDAFGDAVTVAAKLPDLDPALFDLARKRRGGPGDAIERLTAVATAPDAATLGRLRTALAALRDGDGLDGGAGEAEVEEGNVARRLIAFWETLGVCQRKSAIGRTPDGRAVLSGARRHARLADWLDAVEACLEPRDGGVRAMTMHASKGLQEEEVYLFDVTAGVFPSDGATAVQMEDERRIAFVGLSRARRRAVHCFRARPSPFALEAGPFQDDEHPQEAPPGADDSDPPAGTDDGPPSSDPAAGGPDAAYAKLRALSAGLATLSPSAAT